LRVVARPFAFRTVSALRTSAGGRPCT
jgi:hypothetical protein